MNVNDPVAIKRAMLQSSKYLMRHFRPSTKRSVTRHESARSQARILYSALRWFLSHHNNMKGILNLYQREKHQHGLRGRVESSRELVRAHRIARAELSGGGGVEVPADALDESD